MKSIYSIIIIFFMFLNPLYARDFFIEKARPVWKTNLNLNSKVEVKSKFKLKEIHKSLIKEVYEQIYIKFYEYMNINKDMCSNSNLNIRIISENDLDSRIYFAGESTFAKNGNIIFGRYFKYSKILYIVPPYERDYYWRSNFAHEMLHYLYYDCNIYFENIDNEHIHIEEFIKTYKRFFY